MAGFRQIHTKIWIDEWFIELEADEKLLFIYLFSNDEASISGLYKLPIRVMSNETGLEMKRIQNILTKFERAGKVLYRDGVVWVVNMPRYHANPSPLTQKKIGNDLGMIGDCELKRMYLQGINTHAIPMAYPSTEDKDKEEDKEENKDKEINGAGAPTVLTLSKQERTEKRNELVKHFMQKTGLPFGGDVRAKQKLWWTPADKILEYAGGDIPIAISIVDQSLLRLKNVTVTDMNSILKTAGAVYASSNGGGTEYAEVY
jgi:hypothetical protein